MKYTVIKAMKHGGKRYEKGSEIELTEANASLIKKFIEPIVEETTTEITTDVAEDKKKKKGGK